MEDLLRIGVVTTTHGIKGEVKVFPTTDDIKHPAGKSPQGIHGARTRLILIECQP